ncbi:T9SS type A sorting domain-containing protein [candidate division KSB1 bacterium]|nr:T9SS type A sorting domain-containing protein [candidate division KSB1 bacterium]
MFFLEFDSEISGTSGKDCPIYASVVLTTDGGSTWKTVKQWSKETPGSEYSIDHTKYFHSFNIAPLIKGAKSVQFRFWWRNLNNSGEPASWTIDNVTLIVRYIYSCNDPDTGAISDKFELKQNFPNPFNASTTFKFNMPEQSSITIKVFNTLGQEVKTLVDKNYGPGFHEIVWDGRDNSGQFVTSGLYFYKMQAGDFMEIKKLIIIR